MSTEIAERTTSGALALAPDQTEWTAAQTAALRQIGLEDAAPADLDVFLHVAQRSGLDPFARQIHMVGRRQKRWDPNTRQETWTTKYTIQTGIDGFRLIADRTGKYRGQVGPQWCGPDGNWRDVWLEPGPPAAARVGVLRSDFNEVLWGVATFREYAQTRNNGELNSMWASKGAIMIAKCAEALALRKAFPQDLSGLYTAEEMAQADQQLEEPTPRPRNGAGPIVDAEVVAPTRPCGHPGDPTTRCGACIAEQHNAAHQPTRETNSNVVDADPAPAPATRPVLPDDFDAIVANAEEKLDRAGLLDLLALASASGNRMAQAAVQAAGRRVDRELAAQQNGEPA